MDIGQTLMLFFLAAPFLAFCISLYAGIALESIQNENYVIMLVYTPIAFGLIIFIFSQPLIGIPTAIWFVLFLNMGVWDGILKKNK